MYNLDQIFKEASNDFATSNLSAENYSAYMLLGVKITKDEEGLIKIYDPTKKGQYYRECSDQDYVLYKKKWMETRSLFNNTSKV